MGCVQAKGVAVDANDARVGTAEQSQRHADRPQQRQRRRQRPPAATVTRRQRAQYRRRAAATWSKTGVVSLQRSDQDRDSRACALRAVPEEALELGATVRVLHAPANCIQELPADIGARLPNLTRLEVRGNCLRALPASLFFAACAAHLQRVDASANRIDDVDGVPPADDGHEAHAPPAALEWLSLADNCLERVPAALGCRGAGARLRYLDLSGNRLRTLPPWLGRALPALEVLDLRRNALRAVPNEALRGLARLSHLRLDGNARLERLPSQLFVECASLRVLSMAPEDEDDHHRHHHRRRHDNGDGSAERDRHPGRQTLASLEAMPGYAAFDERRRAHCNRQLAAGVDVP